MANIFANIARRATTLSPLMEERERMSMDDIINKYPDGVTITGFDMINTGGDTYPILIIKEDDSIFLFGGAIMNNICHDWLEAFEGDISATNNALTGSGGCKVKFEKSRTKKGNSITTVTVLED